MTRRQINQYAAVYRKKHRLEIRAKMRHRMQKWRDENPKRARLASLEARYRHIKGLGSVAAYRRKYREQKGRCAVCGRKKPALKRSGLHADHNHQTGIFRGLVCARCNMLIGYYEKAFYLWEKVETYLHER